MSAEIDKCQVNVSNLASTGVLSGGKAQLKVSASTKYASDL